jgi:hypothetical protein
LLALLFRQDEMIPESIRKNKFLLCRAEADGNYVIPEVTDFPLSESLMPHSFINYIHINRLPFVNSKKRRAFHIHATRQKYKSPSVSCQTVLFIFNKSELKFPAPKGPEYKNKKGFSFVTTKLS